MSLWTDKFIHINEFTRPGTKLNGVKKIITHYTANPGATALNHFNYFDKTAPAQGRYASAHIFVDKNESYCIIPLNEVAYAANDGSYRGVPELKPNANFLSISVELCLENDGSFHPNTINIAAEIHAELCRRFNLDPIRDIVRHYDVTHKNCPAPWVMNSQGFADFKNLVKSKLNGGGVVAVANQGIGTIEMAADSVVRKEPTAYSDGVGNVKAGDKYIVNQVKDGWYEIGGWVYKDQIKFDWYDVVIGGFNQFESDESFAQVKKAFPAWHVEKRKQ